MPRQYRLGVVTCQAYRRARAIVTTLCNVVQRLLLLSRLLTALLLSILSLLLLIHHNEALNDPFSRCYWSIVYWTRHAMDGGQDAARGCAITNQSFYALWSQLAVV